MIQHPFRRLACYFGALSIIVLLASQAVASPSDLDLTFNGTGSVTTQVATYHFGAFVALQPDGRIVTAGTVAFAGEQGFVGLTRHDRDGRLDPSFGVDGIVRDFERPPDAPTLNAVALQPDGKILIVGSTLGARDAFLLIRYNANGSRDLTFGSNGVVITDLSPYDATIKSVVVQTDGSIVVAGETQRIVVNGDNEVFFTLARYMPSGAIDPTFGSNGLVTTAFELKASANALALQPDGKIVAAGYTRPSGISPTSVALARYTTDGALDTSFGTNGIVIAHPVDPDQYVNAVTVSIQTDGKIVIAGEPGFSFVRFTANGSLDTSFGQQGIATSALAPFAIVRSMVLQPDGRIIAAGASGDRPSFALVRYYATGQPDTSFGAMGIVRSSIGSASGAYSVVLQPDGKIVAAGVGDGGDAFALARYLGDSGGITPSGMVSVPTLSVLGIFALSAMIVSFAMFAVRKRIS